MTSRDSAAEESNSWIESNYPRVSYTNYCDGSLTVFFDFKQEIEVTIYYDSCYPKTPCAFKFTKPRDQENGEERVIREYVEMKEPTRVRQVLEYIKEIYFLLNVQEEPLNEVEEDIHIETLDKEDTEELVQDILESHKNDERIEIDPGSEGLWKVTYHLGNGKDVEVGIDVTDLKSSYPKARILSPKIQVDGKNGITSTGEIVTTLFTPSTWTGTTDFVESLYNDLSSKELEVIDEEYSKPYSTSIQKRMIKDRGDSILESGSSEKSVALVSPSTYSSLGLDTSKHLLVTSPSNLTTSVAVEPSPVKDDIIFLPSHTLSNLFLSGGEKVGVTVTSLPLASKVVLEVEDKDFLKKRNMESVLSKSLDEYKVLSEGDVIEVNGSRIHVVETKPSVHVSMTTDDWENKNNVEIVVNEPQSEYLTPTKNHSVFRLY